MGNSNPSAETLLTIRLQYDVNINWLLTDLDSEDGITYEDYNEKKLVNAYKELNDYDKNEVIVIIELKIRLKSN
ncbi:hypothetical protein D3C75_331420 [compost metagenome]